MKFTNIVPEEELTKKLIMQKFLLAMFMPLWDSHAYPIIAYEYDLAPHIVSIFQLLV